MNGKVASWVDVWQAGFFEEDNVMMTNKQEYPTNLQIARDYNKHLKEWASNIIMLNDWIFYMQI